MPVIKK
jgi:superfamily II DNA/RNA helicase